MILRPYQERFFDSVAGHIQHGVNRQLGVLATGLGKACLFAALRERLGFQRKIMVLVHREELANQAADKLHRWNPHLRVGVEMANRWADVDGIFPHTLIVASVPTLGRRGSSRIKRFLPEEFDAIVSDEAHHSTSPQWKNVLAHFELVKPNQNHILSLGLTATPNRSDGQGLRENFDVIAFDMGIRQGIESGYLVDLRGIRVSTKTNLDAVHTRAGDFAEDELSDAVNTNTRNAAVVKEWMKHAYGLPTIVFTVDIQHAVDLAAVFKKCSVSAEAVWGDDPERANKLRDHRDGRITVLCNCAVLCLDSETEILTSRGWTGIDEMTMQHKVANWEDGRIWFEEPRFIVRRDRKPDEKMISYSSARHDFRVTEDHRMIVKRDGFCPSCFGAGASKNGRLCADCGGMGKNWKISHARKLSGKRAIVPTCGVAAPFAFEVGERSAKTLTKRLLSANSYNLRKNEGYGMRESKIEAERRHNERYSLERRYPHELSLDECRFIGFWIGDGTVSNLQSGGVEYSCIQSMVYPYIIEWFDGVIASCGFDAVRKEHPDRLNGDVRWSFARGTGFGPQRRNGLYPIEPYLKKLGSSLFWGMNCEQFSALIEGLDKAEGKHVKTRPGIRFDMANKPLLDLLQAIAVCRGLTAYVRPCAAPKEENHAQQYTFSCSQMKTKTLGAGSDTITAETEPKDERVWCVTSTSGNIVTRRRGCVTVTGNTEGYDDWRIRCIVLAKPTKSALLYTQMIGRGTRIPEGVDNILTWPGDLEKRDCLIMDVVDCTSKHTLMTMPSLLGMPTNLDLKGKSVIKAKEQFERVAREFPTADLTEVLNLSKLDSIAENISLFQVHYPPEIGKLSDLKWKKSGDDGYMIAVDRASLVTVQKNLIGEWDIKGHIGEKPLEMSAQNLPGAMNLADSFILANGGIKPYLAREAGWHSGQPSPAQISLCKKLGIAIPANATKGQVSVAIDTKLNSGRVTA